MARKTISDVLQDHFFWAFDGTGGGVFPVFNPLFGFSRISSPEISLEVESFKDGTAMYPRHVAKGGSVGSIVFERAASMFDSDFYEWINFAVEGNKKFIEAGTLGGKVTDWANRVSDALSQTPRRTIIIIQFSRINLNSGSLASAAFATAFASGSVAGVPASAVAGIGAATLLGAGPFEFAGRLPARGWVLQGCLPVRYKPASDFDASSGQVSLQELEVQPESVEELSFGGPRP